MEGGAATFAHNPDTFACAHRKPLPPMEAHCFTPLSCMFVACYTVGYGLERQSWTRGRGRACKCSREEAKGEGSSVGRSAKSTKSTCMPLHENRGDETQGQGRACGGGNRGRRKHEWFRRKQSGAWLFWGFWCRCDEQRLLLCVQGRGAERRAPPFWCARLWKAAKKQRDKAVLIFRRWWGAKGGRCDENTQAASIVALCCHRFGYFKLGPHLAASQFNGS